MGISRKLNNNGHPKGSGGADDNPAGSNQHLALRIVIAGGGTGGHLFPGIAIAEMFMKKNPHTRILFVTSGRAIEETVLAKTPYEKRMIAVEGIKGKRMFSKLGSMTRLPKGLIDAIRLLVEFKPDVVIGMGAYSAGPVVAAAWLLRIHRVIHEQNSLPGLTNRLLSGLAERIYVSFPETGFKSSCMHKITLTGNPVRNEILESVKTGTNEERRSKDPDQPFTVLVLGGSQGAHSINMAVLDSVTYLKNPEKFRFVHQTGTADADEVEKVYHQLKIKAVVAPFFNDMPDRYAEADLVICRSGATTVAELTLAGLAAVFVPFPFAADDHQVVNARALVDDNAAEMILESDLNGKILSDRIAYYLEHPEATRRMRQKIRAFGHPDAGRRITDDIYRLIDAHTRKRNGETET